MPRLIAGRLPPTEGTGDKFYFIVAPGVKIEAPLKDELIRRVFEYRLRNGITIGDVEKDIDEAYCSRYPRFCTDDPHDRDPTKPRVSGESMLNRVSRWAALMIRGMPRGGYALVTSAEAEDRAAICTNCSMNIAWRGGCGGCSGSTLQLLQQLKALRKTKRDGNLAACAVTSAENSASVWIPLESNPLSDEQRAQLPAQCWRKAT
jgi:hypothetical protein